MSLRIEIQVGMLKISIEVDQRQHKERIQKLIPKDQEK